MKKLLFIAITALLFSDCRAEEGGEGSFAASPGEALSFGNRGPSEGEKEKSCRCKEAEVELALTYGSKYVWRGVTLTDGPVLQPDLSVSKCGYKIEVWGNIEATNVNGQEWDFSEVDIILEYSDSFFLCRQKINYTVGAINYLFPASGDPITWELYLRIGLDLFFNPTLTAYYDIDQVNGRYLNFGIGHAWKELFCRSKEIKIGLEIAASIAWGSANFNEFYYGLNRDAFADALFTVSLPAVWKCWTITPFFSGSTLVDKSARERVHPGTNYWGGITFARSF